MQAVQLSFPKQKRLLKSFFILALLFLVGLTSFAPSVLAVKESILVPNQELLTPTTSLQKQASPSTKLAPVYGNPSEVLTPNDPNQPYNTTQTGGVDWKCQFFGSAGNVWCAGTGALEALGVNANFIMDAAKDNLYKFLKEVFQGTLYLMANILAGEDTAKCLDREVKKEADGNPKNCVVVASAAGSGTNANGTNGVTFAPPSGLISMVGYSVDQVSQTVPQAINSKEYLAYINPFKAKEAYAQGVGRETLQGTVLGLWTTLRNASYAFLVLVLVVIGFMIMFRAKMDPRTTVGLVNSLPRVILVLILITFSFPIGALFVDAIGLLLNFIGCGIDLYCRGSGQGYNPSVFQILAESVIVTTLLAGTQIPTIPGLGVIAVVLLMFILILLIFVIITRIGLAFLTEWISLTFTILTGPLFLLGGAVPGSNAIKSWFRRLLAPVLCIVAMYTMIAIAEKFTTLSLLNPSIRFRELGGLARDMEGLGFGIPQAINLTPIPTHYFNDLVALGILLYIPAICTNIRRALDVLMSDQGSINPMEMSREGGQLRGTAVRTLGGATGATGFGATSLARGLRGFFRFGGS